MKKIKLVILVSFITLISCENSKHYKPDGLRKLSDDELIERSRSMNYMTENTEFKDSLGNPISRNELYIFGDEEFFGDQYVNDNNELIEVVFRKATNQDLALIKRMKEAFEETESISIIKIDCSKTQEILESIYESDQGNRQGGSVENPETDKENQQIVVSILENCGFPTVEKHGKKSVEAVFLVIQHAGNTLREKYFPLIKASADQGDLRCSIVALMEDRMLMDRGEKQIYGSQVQMLNGSVVWTLYPIQDPENVNERRAEIGLEPLEEYLLNFGIEYERD